jgi:hypothetical protein
MSQIAPEQESSNNVQRWQEQLHTKLARLEGAYGSETEVAVKYKIEQQIKDIRSQLYVLEQGAEETQEAAQLPEAREWSGELSEEITRLQSQVIKLIPAEELLQGIEYRKRQADDKAQRAVSQEETDLGSFMDDLNSIETQLSSQDIPQDPSKLLQQFSSLKSKINVKIGRLNSKFTVYSHEATGSIAMFENLVSKIGHKEFQEEAQTHLEVIRSLWKQLNPKEAATAIFDVLHDNAYGRMSILAQIEDRKRQVENLIRSDRNRRLKTVGMILCYIALAIGVLAFFIWRNIGQSTGQIPLEHLKLPIIDIPWPVIVWSLIGSFAAMIHQFNKKPIYDFSDAFKWMLTRPVQGAVLGATFYLVVMSGLILLTGAQTPTDEVVLVLSFLVGFSDRFAEQIFNSLVKQYSELKPGAELPPEEEPPPPEEPAPDNG